VVSLHGLLKESDARPERVFFLLPQRLEHTLYSVLRRLPSLSHLQPKVLRLEEEPLAFLHVDKWASRATYGRLLFPLLVKDLTSSLLYLDADTFPVAPIDPLLKEFEVLRSSDCVIAAVQWSPGANHLDRLTSLGVNLDQHFSAGVLLFDVPGWNKINGTATAMELATTYGKRLEYWDQDVLNIQFGDHYLRLPPRYNCLPWAMPPDPAIIHFAGPLKPTAIPAGLPLENDFFKVWVSTFRAPRRAIVKIIRMLGLLFFGLRGLTSRAR